MPSMPQGYLTSTLTAIVNGHKQSRIEELLPWNHLALQSKFHRRARSARSAKVPATSRRQA